MTKMSSTNLSHREGGWEWELRALTSDSSMNRLAMRGLMGEPMEHPGPVHKTYLGRGSIFKADLQKGDYLLDGHVGPLG